MATTYSAEMLAAMNPSEYRAIVRKGELTGRNMEVCRGYGQANLAVVPKEFAADFLMFCHLNPRPCPIFDITEAGDPHPRRIAPEADLRTDLPRYRVFKDGEIIDEPTDAKDYWREDLVAFLLGCSRGFAYIFGKAGLKWRLQGAFTTEIPLVPAGPFHGTMICTARIFATSQDAVRAIQISSRYPAFHGPPIHIGPPELIGIKDISKADMAIMPHPTPPPEPGEICLYWGCGVTPQNAIRESRIPFGITHYAGHMFVFDRPVEEYAML